MSNETKKLHQLAQAEYGRGNLPEARRLSLQLLTLDPADEFALVLLGLAEHRFGNGTAAKDALLRAVQASKGAPEARIALSTVLFDLHEAEAGFEQIVAAIDASPDDPELHHLLGQRLVQAKQYAMAAECFRRVIQLVPGNVAGHQNLAAALRDAGLEGEAREVWREVTRMAPQLFAAWMNLGQLSLAHGDFEEAIRCAERALPLSKKNPVAHLLMALALSEDGRGNEAEPYLLKAIELNPEDGIANASIGFWYQEQGRFAEARVALERSIRVLPSHGFAYYNLFRAKKAEESDLPFLKELEGRADAPGIHGRDRGYMHYSLGKAYEDLGLYEQSFRHYEAGNRDAYAVWLGNRPWDREAYARELDQTRRIFDEERFRSLESAGNADPFPVVIVGMIRSGTSLLEQLLSSHPLVTGAGELPFWHKHEKEALRTDGIPDPAALVALGQRYLGELRKLSNGAARVTDKLPHNYAMLGLIHAALPEARIIHVRRNPTDNCLSVYTTAYQRPPVFAHDRGNIAFAYREYQKMVAHWREVLPADRFMEVDYEALIADRESITRQIIEFVGLDWDPSCLSHESNQRAVRTPSLWQVRQPIYTTSIERWRRYGDWIPEFTALDTRG